MGNFFVGCDIGTSGAKSVLMDDEGKVCASSLITYPLITPRPGWAEQDPEWYWNATAETMRRCIDQSGADPSDIKGVSISAQAPVCILVDKDLKPLQMAHIWMDRRGIRQTEWVKERLGDRASEKSGNPVDAYYLTVKLLWEKENRPDLYQKTYKVLSAANYATMKLTGKAVTDYSNASLYGVGFDIVNKKWDSEVIEMLGLDTEKFPDCYPSDAVIGGVTKAAAERTTLKEGTPVVAGTVDSAAAYIAAGAVEPGDFSLTMGTSGCLGLVHEEPFTRDMITTIHAANSKTTYTTSGCTVSCGALLKYFRDNLGQTELRAEKEIGVDAYDVMTVQAGKIAPGSDGLITLPYFMGERTPIWDPFARGVMFGMSLTHTRAHIIRSYMEGAVYALYHNYKIMLESGCKIHQPLVVGEGGAKSALWRQIVSDVFNIPVTYMSDSKGAPAGNAIIAGVGTGVFKDYRIAKEWVTFSDTHDPDAETHKRYEEYFEIYERLYRKVKDEFVALSNVTGYR